jgi:hypothetical protein
VRISSCDGLLETLLTLTELGALPIERYTAQNHVCLVLKHDGCYRNYLPTEEEISSRYKQLMRQNHPDKVGAAGQEATALINHARQVVSSWSNSFSNACAYENCHAQPQRTDILQSRMPFTHAQRSHLTRIRVQLNEFVGAAPSFSSAVESHKQRNAVSVARKLVCAIKMLARICTVHPFGVMYAG